VDLKDVETFTTDEPIEIRLNDGTVVKGRVGAAEAGSVTAVTGPVALARVKSINPKEGKWTGSVVAGGVVNRGNTDTESLNVAVDAQRRGEDDRVSTNAGYVFSRQKDPSTGDESTSADSWFAAGKYDYFFSDKLYGLASLRADHDRIADLNLRLTPSLGVGYQWVERPDLNFTTEAGLAWVFENYDPGDTDNHAAARLAYHFDTKFNERVAFLHNVEYLPSVEDGADFNVNADAAVRASLTKTMFTEFKFEWRYDATPAPDAQKNDLRYMLGVGWTF
jgi:putative salt-induced outer membrane protein YdiY